METRFVVPVIVSTAFHALVLLLGNGSNPPVTPPGTEITPKPGEIVFRPAEEEPEPADASEESAPAKGAPVIGMPLLDEPWAKVPIDGIVFTPASPRPESMIGDRISDLPPGTTEGIIGGRIGPKIVGANLLDAPPRTRLRVAPDYPREAKVSGLTGEVLVEFLVDESGHVLRPRVVRSTDSRFEAATLRAVERWRFEPGTKDGRIVRFRMAVPVMFTLDD